MTFTVHTDNFRDICKREDEVKSLCQNSSKSVLTHIYMQPLHSLLWPHWTHETYFN